ncbi:MAG TPA: hypothetical protein PK528_14060 [Syntrophorhabdus sp.]|nr:hypothetical protein [Syntrophorhabdus sp.]HQB35031.1 hypothetical protein [Syntrophorhabdus sp.]HQO64730.1 hypothetical protein [Syntrophorhabdus sp.]
MFKKESYVIYDDSALDSDQIVDILKIRAGLSYRFLQNWMKLNLVTMILPSYTFDKDDDGAVYMAKILIINYIYLNVNNFNYSLNDSMRQNFTSMIHLNLLTVCYESLQQKSASHSILNRP